MEVPVLQSFSEKMNQGFRTAIGDIFGNITLFKDGLLEKEKPVILAGLDYDTPWTRDTAIQAWNNLSLFFPDVMENTLLSVLINDPAYGVRIGGQYWDAIIWATGAWQHYLITGDKTFLRLSHEAVAHSLQYFMHTEFDPDLGLFRGGACYGDGIAAYGDEFADTNQGQSGILTWAENNPEKRAKKGEGFPMFTLSTNCLYYQAYRLMQNMEQALGDEVNPVYVQKGKEIKEAINRTFWNEENGTYTYYISPDSKCDAQEGMGISFAILFGIADAQQTEQLMQTAYAAPAGMPCVWPSFSRYRIAEHTYGRHAGTVWPHIQGFWADAAMQSGFAETGYREFSLMQEHAIENGHFSEIYHPITGEPYGGLQESGDSIVAWKSCVRQTWSATGYLRVLIRRIFGMEFTEKGIAFAPNTKYLEGDLPGNKLKLTGIYYHQKRIHIEIEGKGTEIDSIYLDACAMDSNCMMDNQIHDNSTIFIKMRE